MDWQISPGAALIQLQATMAWADTGAGSSRLQIFTSAQPASGDAAGAAPQVEFVLAKPCGVITDGVWSLTAAEPGGTMVLVNGIPRWGRWLTASGAWVADGDVTDLAGGGAIRIAGGATPEGDNSPMLYAGGLAILGATAFT